MLTKNVRFDMLQREAFMENPTVKQLFAELIVLKR